MRTLSFCDYQEHAQIVLHGLLHNILDLRYREKALEAALTKIKEMTDDKEIKAFIESVQIATEHHRNKP